MMKIVLWKTVMVITVTLFSVTAFASKPPDDAQKTEILNKAISYADTLYREQGSDRE